MIAMTAIVGRIAWGKSEPRNLVCYADEKLTVEGLLAR